MSVISLAEWKRPAAPPAIVESFQVSEPPRRQPHPLDLVDVIATLAPSRGGYLADLAESLRQQSAEDRRPAPIRPGCRKSLPAYRLPEVAYELDWDRTDGAFFLEVRLTRKRAAVMVAALRQAGLVDETDAA